MLKILVPTDFSDHANNALDYAVNIINQTGGRILLYNVYQVQSTTGSFVSIEKYISEDAEAEMQKILRRVEPQLKGTAIIDSKVTRGHTVSLICKVADKANYDLIVMGTQGKTGLKGVFIGSNTVGIMNGAETPVLAIPNGFKYRPMKKIVLAIDSEPISSKAVINSLQRIIKAFKPEVSVFHLETELVDAGIDPSVDIYLENINYTTYQRVTKDGFHDSINHFVAEENADMLCMIRRKRGLLYEILHPSTTRKKVFDSPVPLLILHD
jgi:nucleotide-binding universal stress UspA family protein